MADNKKTPVTDDQELAKVLASMNDQANTAEQPAAANSSEQTNQTPSTPPTVQSVSTPASDDNVPPIPATLPSNSTPTAPAAAPASSAPVPTSPAVPAQAAGPLDDIKRQALQELRPIVSKLDLPAEEKFDALLLVIRSSDDQSLVQAAYQAAEGITDEAKKAQALLDIVKEIEYFSSQKPAA